MSSQAVSQTLINAYGSVSQMPGSIGMSNPDAVIQISPFAMQMLQNQPIPVLDAWRPAQVMSETLQVALMAMITS